MRESERQRVASKSSLKLSRRFNLNMENGKCTWYSCDCSHRKSGMGWRSLSICGFHLMLWFFLHFTHNNFWLNSGSM